MLCVRVNENIMPGKQFSHYSIRDTDKTYFSETYHEKYKNDGQKHPFSANHIKNAQKIRKNSGEITIQWLKIHKK